MMTKDATRLLEDALRLRPEDRAQLAEELLASLDETEQDVGHSVDGIAVGWAALRWYRKTHTDRSASVADLLHILRFRFAPG